VSHFKDMEIFVLNPLSHPLLKFRPFGRIVSVFRSADSDTRNANDSTTVGQIVFEKNDERSDRF
jgi:hypothetical protein